MAQIDQARTGAANPSVEAGPAPVVTDISPDTDTTPTMPAPPNVGGSVGDVPQGTDVRNENAPEIDNLRSKIDDLRQRISRLQERPTQSDLQSARSEADEVRENAERAVQVAYRLGVARVIKAIRQ